MKLLKIILCITLCLTVFCSCNNANNNNANDNNDSTNDETKPEFAGGDGTEARPYIIAESYQWLNIANHLDAHFKLAADLNMGDYEKLAPIGTDSTPFTGVLDGDGHKIVGANVVCGNKKLNSGLFAHISGATVKNLNFETSTIKGSYDKNKHTYFGILVGQAKTGSLIENCHVKDVSASLYALSDNSYFGGLVGGLFSLSEVKYCSVDYTMKADSYASFNFGGGFGLVEAATVDCVSITGSYKINPQDHYIYNNDKKSASIVYKTNNCNISNVWSDLEIIDNPSKVCAAQLAFTVNDENDLTNCVSFSAFANTPETKYHTVSVERSDSDNVNLYIAPANLLDTDMIARKITDSEHFSDIWIEGKIHPVFVDYETYLSLTAEAE